MGIGGDIIAGTDFVDALKAFEEDPETEAVVMFGELGGRSELKAAEFIEKEMNKPVVAFIAGEFTESLPSKQYGHAGAIIRAEKERPSYKKKRLEEAGAHVMEMHHEIGEKLKTVLH